MSYPRSSGSANPRLILCIDDADIALRVRKLLLNSEGYNVVTASTGEEGLEIFKTNAIELVISDHFLSGKSGTDIAREMRELKPEVPILIVSAASETPRGIEFADGFLAKGQLPAVLLDTIAHLLPE